MQVTDEELEAVARAIAASVLDCLCAKRWVNNAAREAFVAGVVTDYLPVARAAILAYLAAPGQVRLHGLQVEYGAMAEKFVNMIIEHDELKQRYTWLADKVLACDYGDNERGVIGWIIRHCKGPQWIEGPSIDAAIDAARAAEGKS